ncbi:MAG: hypothetical protein F4Y40_04490 [Acidimicrobiia bacterium]|nr:hypothetical protein [Acidimicrobiia bacterium]
MPFLLTARNRAVLARIPGLALGLVMFGAGIGFNIRANLGLSPWDAFHQGIALRTPLSVGLVTIGVSMVVLLGWIPLRQRPGLGTLLNATLVGVMVDLTLFVVGETETLWLRVLYLVGGIGLLAIGSGLYIGSRLGPGPRDGIMTGLAARGMSIRSARTLIEGTVLIAGWLLGGAVGIGTVIYTVTIGPLLQITLRRADKGPL